MTITEFESLDPEEFHLVPRGATGFPVLLAKAVEESVETELFKAESEVYKKDYSAEERRKMAHEGKALPNGSYPIDDKEDLHNAAILARSGHGDVAGAKRLIARRAKELGVSNPLDDDAEKQTAPDKDLHESEAESQTREVGDPEPAGPSPDNEDHGEPRSVSFPHGACGDGDGDTAPDKDIHQGEAESQTHDNIEGNPAAKAEVDGRGSVMEDKDVDHAEEESQTDDNVEGNTSKADADTPGSDAWEHKDVALGERAEQLASQLGDVVRTFTEREKAEGGASKSTWRVIRRIRSLLENPTLIKEIAETMDATELLKALDGLDEARRAEKKARKEKEAKKAAKMAAEAAEAANAAKATEDDAVKATDEQIASLQKQIDELTAKRPFVNGLGVTAVLRGPEGESALKSFDARVQAAEARLEKASSDYERQQAVTELESARKSRLMAKMVAQSNAQAEGRIRPGRFGHNSTDLFGGSSLSLPEDSALKAI